MDQGHPAAVVDVLRRNPGWTAARVLVCDPSFRHSGEALRLHLEAEAPDLDLRHVEVVAVPVVALCLGCGERASIRRPTDGCPERGGCVLPASSSPTVEIQLSVAPPPP